MFRPIVIWSIMEVWILSMKSSITERWIIRKPVPSRTGTGSLSFTSVPPSSTDGLKTKSPVNRFRISAPSSHLLRLQVEFVQTCSQAMVFLVYGADRIFRGFHPCLVHLRVQGESRVSWIKVDVCINEEQPLKGFSF